MRWRPGRRLMPVVALAAVISGCGGGGSGGASAPSATTAVPTAASSGAASAASSGAASAASSGAASESASAPAATGPPTGGTASAADEAGTVARYVDHPPQPRRTVNTAEGLTGFRTPSGAIVCMLDRDWVRCDTHYTGPLPPKPAGCDLDWGPVATLTATASMGQCVSDAADGRTVLDYGAMLVHGRFRCYSEASGLSCWNVTTRSGFTVSRERYVLVNS